MEEEAASTVAPLRPRNSPHRTPRWVKYLLGILGGVLVVAMVVVLIIAFFPSDHEACVAPVDEGDGGLCCQAVHQHAARARILAAGFGWVFTITGYLAGLLGGLLGPAWAERAAREVPASQPVPVWPRVAGTFIAATGVSLGSVGTMLVGRGQEAGIAAAGALNAPAIVAARRGAEDPSILGRSDDELLHEQCSATMARWVLFAGVAPSAYLNQGSVATATASPQSGDGIMTSLLRFGSVVPKSADAPAAAETDDEAPPP